MRNASRNGRNRTVAVVFIAAFIGAVPLNAAAQAKPDGITKFRVKMINSTGDKKGKSTDADLTFDRSANRVNVRNKETTLEVPYDAVTSLLYERTAKPRYALGLVAWPLMFTKSKNHYLTVQFKKVDTTEYLVLQLDKKDFQNAISSAEAHTGKKVERSDEK